MENIDKTWMYNRLKNGFITEEYFNGVEKFVEFAINHPECLSAGQLRCPCNRKKCQNRTFLDADTVKVHLGRYGFVPDYTNWYFHGEEYIRPSFPNINLEVPSSSNLRRNAFSSGTGMTKHIGGSKSFSSHIVDLRTSLGREPTSWELFVKTHRRQDGTFVDERSRLIHAEMEARLTECLSQHHDGLVSEPPTAEQLNEMYIDIVGGVNRRKVYGIGTAATTFYPDSMTPRPRGASSSGGTASVSAVREEARVAREEARIARDEARAATQRMDKQQSENEMLRARISSLEESVRLLVAGMSRGVPVQLPYGDVGSSRRITRRAARSNDDHSSPVPLPHGGSRKAPKLEYLNDNDEDDGDGDETEDPRRLY